jgi:anti-sigma regulatory factor (Ser/Thr protein kinase)
VAYSPVAARADFRHVCFFYRTDADYAATVAGFLRGALEAGEAAFAAVPPAKAGLIRDALGADARDVDFADMTTLGRNPARIIPRVLTFTGAHAGHVRYVGEPIWPARTTAELREATRHEALINLAFEDADAEILCPYDIAELDPAVIADARRTHPLVLSSGGRVRSPEYDVQPESLLSPSLPLPAPDGGATYHSYRTDLSRVRAVVFKHGVAAGLTESRANDLVLAVSEVAANTLRHTRSSGTLALWRDRDEVICEVHDEGSIADPLAGRRMPAPDAAGGHGLWLVHQVCDLVELNSDANGTTIRMHMAVRTPPVAV